MEERKQVVLSGIRATGKMHVGNYIGAMRHFVELSRDPKYDCFFFVADLHTLTTLVDRASLTTHLPNIVLDYLAAGIDPVKSIIFVQSSVPETCELFWLLLNLMPVADMLNCPSYKDKAKKNPQNGGLLCYPVLMAADILGPKGEIVPVGSDQIVHVEMARELARRFNKEFDVDLFPEPQHLEGAVVVRGLQGEEKMGKSEDSRSTIFLDEDKESVWGKLKVAITDPVRQKRSDPGNSAVCNVFALHTSISPEDVMREMAEGCRTAGIGCFDCKKRLMTHLWDDLLEPFQQSRAKIVSLGTDYVRDVLMDGGKRARAVIAPTVQRAQELMRVASYH